MGGATGAAGVDVGSGPGVAVGGTGEAAGGGNSVGAGVDVVYEVTYSDLLGTRYRTRGHEPDPERGLLLEIERQDPRDSSWNPILGVPAFYGIPE